MVNKTLSKVPKECKYYLDCIKDSISFYNDQKIREENLKKLSGYLQCLVDMKIIKLSEGKEIYQYYSELK